MDNLDYIESYFTNGPDPSRSQEFEQRIHSDPAFAEEVAFYLSALTLARENAEAASKQRFRKIYQENEVAGSSPGLKSAGPSPQVKNIAPSPVRRIISYMTAAAVAAGIIFGIYTVTSKESPEQLAARYEKEHLTTLGVVMSGRTDSIQTGLRLYNEGKSGEALLHFEKIIASDTSNFTAKEYAGLAALQQKNYSKALVYFEQLETYNGLYANPALFYQALTFMERNQTGDREKAKQILNRIIANDLEGKETAQEWIRKI